MKSNELHHVLNEIPGTSSIKENITGILSSISASIYWKDKNGIYQGANDVFLRLSLLEKHENIIGKKDRELMWAEQAPILERNDQEIIHSYSSKTYIEQVKCHVNEKIELFLSHKIPLKNDKGNNIGIFGLSILLDDKISFQHITCPSRYLTQLNTTLTERQKDCVYYLTLGMTTKKIGKKLNLSPKTIEHYLENIKKKLKVNTRAELIAKASLIFNII